MQWMAKRNSNAHGFFPPRDMEHDHWVEKIMQARCLFHVNAHGLFPSRDKQADEAKKEAGQIRPHREKSQYPFMGGEKTLTFSEKLIVRRWSAFVWPSGTSCPNQSPADASRLPV